MTSPKIFIDADILLDTLLRREPHCYFSNKILSHCEEKQIQGFTSTLILANLYYILRKLSHHTKALEAIHKIRSLVQILPFTDNEVEASINSSFSDFEDGIQYFIALHHKIPHLITRNIEDFKKANIIISSAQDFLLTFNKGDI